MTDLVPSSHRDLLDDTTPALAVLATTMADSTPQVTPVWFDVVDGLIRINTARGRTKYKNMLERPQVALAIIDPKDSYRFIQIRGRVVASTEKGGREHIGRLGKKYRSWGLYPVDPVPVRVIFSIRPEHVTVAT
jgi:PPOX class probable F420-dependent enzyme